MNGKKTMKAYKGFDKNMQCRGFQYEEGKTYHEDTAKSCNSGFHACEMPIDVFRYYMPGDSIYREVEVDDIVDERKIGDSEICSKTIKIGAEIGIQGIIKAQMEHFNSRNCKGQSEYVDIVGPDRIVYNFQDNGNAYNTGVRATSFTSEHGGTAWAKGIRAVSCASGSFGVSFSDGYCGSSLATGNNGISCATGVNSISYTEGKASCAINCGSNGLVMGAIGCVLFAVERGHWNGKVLPIISVAAAIVDGENIKPGVWYKCEGGKLVEA